MRASEKPDIQQSTYTNVSNSCSPRHLIGNKTAILSIGGNSDERPLAKAIVEPNVCRTDAKENRTLKGKDKRLTLFSRRLLVSDVVCKFRHELGEEPAQNATLMVVEACL